MKFEKIWDFQKVIFLCAKISFLKNQIKSTKPYLICYNCVQFLSARHFTKKRRNYFIPMCIANMLRRHLKIVFTFYTKVSNVTWLLMCEQIDYIAFIKFLWHLFKLVIGFFHVEGLDWYFIHRKANIHKIRLNWLKFKSILNIYKIVH